MPARITFDPINARVPFSVGPNGGVAIEVQTLTNFSDNVEVKTSSEDVFGRTDPIYNYGGTNRKISFSATTKDTTGLTQLSVRELQQLQYPTYIKEEKRGPILFSPPLVRVRYSPNAIEDGDMGDILFDEIGFLSGVKFGTDAGGLVPTALGIKTFPDEFGIVKAESIIAPDDIDFGFDLTIIHREIAGFNNSQVSNINAATMLGPKNPSLPFSFD